VSTIHEIGQRDFFDTVELGTIENPQERKRVSQVVKDYELSVGFGAQPIILGRNLNLNAIEPGIRRFAVQTLKEFIDQASELEATSFVIMSGRDPGDSERLMAYDFLAESISELCDHAAQFSMDIVLETFDRSVDKKALVGPSDEAANLAKTLKPGYPQFGLLYDMGHMPLLDEEPFEALGLLHNYLAEVHLGNCVKTPGLPAFGDKHPRFGFEGGVNDTKELVIFLKALFVTGFLGESLSSAELPWVGFEVRPHQEETSQQILDNIQHTWTKAWEQL
ncbi:MAG: sugar phosphate isomerase/epimerase, partial [Anaerolineaceae bacterium]|nr:sugar phosphate isomerase/epimerase [Anaerolineaceae bacterium]